MTTRVTTVHEPDPDALATPDPVAAAREYVAAQALRPDERGRVGLELEYHLVDLADPGRRPDWADVQALTAALPPMPSCSSVTLEPGGQVELSTPPSADLADAVAALRADGEALRSGAARAGFGVAALGADPARGVRRSNPGARYVAMEQHFDAVGCPGAGRAMMASTAALQVNLDAGAAPGWRARLDLLRSLVPVLVAASSSSPYLGGRASGWHSMRQETWAGIDGDRSGPVPDDDEPAAAWASYALAAPVMLVRDGDRCTPVTTRVGFGEWLADPSRIGRAATTADLDYHLSTLFPPVRPRGYLEIRCIDALPDRWWPALAGLVVTLVDDPVAADAARDLAAPVAGLWEEAARQGLAHPAVAAAASACADLAARRCDPAVRPEAEDLAALLASGRTPSSELRARIEAVGPLRVLEEEAR